METNGRVILILPHPDDEVFCLHILKEFPDHKKVFIYLTNGTPTNDPEMSLLRSSESRQAIRFISHGAEIVPYGLQSEITDGKLAQKFTNEDYRWLINYLKRGTCPSVFISPALEGGHQDHDAAFLIAKNLSRYWSAKHYSFPLYSSSRFEFPFFRVMKKDYGYIKFNQTLASRLDLLKTALKLVKIYSSQRKTWVGLSLPVLIHYTFASPIYFLNQSKELATISKFLYESRKKESHETLMGFEGKLFEK